MAVFVKRRKLIHQRLFVRRDRRHRYPASQSVYLSINHLIDIGSHELAFWRFIVAFVFRLVFFSQFCPRALLVCRANLKKGLRVLLQITIEPRGLNQIRERLCRRAVKTSLRYRVV